MLAKALVNRPKVLAPGAAHAASLEPDSHDRIRRVLLDYRRRDRRPPWCSPPPT